MHITSITHAIQVAILLLIAIVAILALIKQARETFEPRAWEEVPLCTLTVADAERFYDNGFAVVCGDGMPAKIMPE